MNWNFRSQTSSRGAGAQSCRAGVKHHCQQPPLWDVRESLPICSRQPCWGKAREPPALSHTAFSLWSSPAFPSPCAPFSSPFAGLSAVCLQLLSCPSPVLTRASTSHMPKTARKGLPFGDVTGKNPAGYLPSPQAPLQPGRFTTSLSCTGA